VHEFNFKRAEYKLLLLWFFVIALKSIAQVMRYFTAFHSNSIQTAQCTTHQGNIN